MTIQQATPASAGTEQEAWIGRRLPRVEDDRLLRGNGRYADDLGLPGTLELAFLRSPHAHARITSLDTEAAAHLPGVHAIWTGEDTAALAPLLNRAELAVPAGLQEALDPLVRALPMALLAGEKVTFVGQPVALVAADSRYLAEDALELIEVEYEPLDVVVDPEAALRPDSPRVEESWDDNVALALDTTVGDPQAAFAEAACVIEEEFRSHRYVASPIEPRGITAAPGGYDGRLTVWSSHQTPHRVRDTVAGTLGLDPEQVHVIATDVGGGFGQKGVLYVEDLLVPFAAHRLGRPVSWREDRNENLTGTAHAREQTHRISLAADAEGRLLGLRDEILVNFGATTITGLVVPYNSLCHLLGPYRVPHVHIDVKAVLTNTTYTAPYRGAGRPEAVFAMERAMDRLAAELGIEPAELRARNLIPPEAMPYRTGLVDRAGNPQEYDSGDFPELLRRAVDRIDVPAVRERQRAGEREGHRVGVGFAVYLEATGLGPFESARVRLRRNGRVGLYLGTPSQGQGHRTSMAQIAADALGVSPSVVDVVGGDTDTVPFGVGTIASRALVTAGNATHRAGRLLREKILHSASARLGTPADELTVVDGVVLPLKSADEGAGSEAPEGLPLAALVDSPMTVPDGLGADLSETAHFRPPGFTFAAGAHAVVVDVDTRTGEVEIERYVVVHDAGRIVNPMIAEAQVTGGVAQGIGGALYEEMAYGPDGQPVTTTYMDYLLPTSSEIPDLELDETHTHSTLNDLGVKGLGEGGAIAPQAVISNAVEDALRPYGAVVRRGPLTPHRVRALIRESAEEQGDAERPAVPTA